MAAKKNADKKSAKSKTLVHLAPENRPTQQTLAGTAAPAVGSEPMAKLPPHPPASNDEPKHSEKTDRIINAMRNASDDEVDAAIAFITKVRTDAIQADYEAKLAALNEVKAAMRAKGFKVPGDPAPADSTDKSSKKTRGASKPRGEASDEVKAYAKKLVKAVEANPNQLAGVYYEALKLKAHKGGNPDHKTTWLEVVDYVVDETKEIKTKGKSRGTRYLLA